MNLNIARCAITYVLTNYSHVMVLMWFQKKNCRTGSSSHWTLHWYWTIWRPYDSLRAQKVLIPDEHLSIITEFLQFSMPADSPPLFINVDSYLSADVPNCMEPNLTTLLWTVTETQMGDERGWGKGRKNQTCCMRVLSGVITTKTEAS